MWVRKDLVLRKRKSLLVFDASNHFITVITQGFKNFIWEADDELGVGNQNNEGHPQPYGSADIEEPANLLNGWDTEEEALNQRD